MTDPAADKDADAAGAAAFAALLLREGEMIAARRAGRDPADAAAACGLALSGGGIRSATFSLGLLQALSAARLVPRIDYLSTVSGGSFIGSFFQALFVPQSFRGDGTVWPTQLSLDPADPLHSSAGLEATRRLRDAGRYLTPGGTSDAFFAAAVVARNWTALHLVIGLAAFTVFWMLGLADRWLADTPFHTAGVSPSLLLLLWAAAIVVLASSAAYWFTRRDWIPGSRFGRAFGNGFFDVMVLASLYLTIPWWHRIWTPPLGTWLPRPGGLTTSLALVSIASVLVYAVAEARRGGVEHRPLKDASPAAERVHRAAELRNPQYLNAAEDRVRTLLSSLMATTLMVATGVAGLAIIVRCGVALQALLRTALAQLQTPNLAVHTNIAALLKILSPLAAPLLSYVASTRLKTGSGQVGGSWLERHVPSVIVVLGMVLLVLWLIVWSTAWAAALTLLARAPPPVMGIPPLYGVGLLLLPANLIVGLSFSFINLSSLSTFYAARLRRAYIGASSLQRAQGSVRVDQPQDTISLDNYYAGAASTGAPLHLLNVTIAETVLGESELVARDRKGKPMHLSPTGIVFEGSRPGTVQVGRSANAAFRLEFGEELPLANWVAISGAAVSAAIGAGTSLGTSILATLGNVRLGYWWKRDHARQSLGALLRPGNLVQYYLSLELRGAFRGTRQPRWYLTDGGHFENTGAYALLQRKLGFIIICDNGADPDYRMADVVRLIDHARTDLGARIDFLDDAALRVKLGAGSDLLTAIGPFAALARRGDAARAGGPIAALAAITYDDHSTGTLLLVKPRLTFDEPPELLAYQAAPANVSFPQQTTANQFFDEAQWEAYRRLGELAGQRLFGSVGSAGAGWRPGTMAP